MKANVSNAYDESRTPGVPERNAVRAAGVVETAEAAGKPTRSKSKRSSKAGSAKWLIAGLLFLSFIPMTAGAHRLTQLTGGAEITPDNARFFASPLPVMLHIVSASIYCILGAFQFSPAFRRRRPGWHRIAGRLLVPAGLLVALSALWMTLFYPRPAGDGDLLAAFRLLFGSAMIASIILGFASIMQRDIKAHRAWMMRAYAIGLGAGTQALVLMAGEIIAGKPGELSRALLMGASWVINLSVAEWAIRRHLRPARNRAAGRPTDRQTDHASASRLRLINAYQGLDVVSDTSSGERGGKIVAPTTLSLIDQHINHHIW